MRRALQAKLATYAPASWKLLLPAYGRRTLYLQGFIATVAGDIIMATSNGRSLSDELTWQVER
jgi:hypothetical protein